MGLCVHCHPWAMHPKHSRGYQSITAPWMSTAIAPLHSIKSYGAWTWEYFHYPPGIAPHVLQGRRACCLRLTVQRNKYSFVLISLGLKLHICVGIDIKVECLWCWSFFHTAYTKHTMYTNQHWHCTFVLKCWVSTLRDSLHKPLWRNKVCVSPVWPAVSNPPLCNSAVEALPTWDYTCIGGRWESQLVQPIFKPC